MTKRDATRPVAREAAIERFIGTHADYYKRAFAAIGQSPGFVFSFNPAAALFGPVWFGGRRPRRRGSPPSPRMARCRCSPSVSDCSSRSGR